LEGRTKSDMWVSLSSDIGVWSPDSAHLAVADSGTGVRIFDSGTGNQLTAMNGHNAIVDSLDWSPDGSRLISASRDGTLRLWDAESGTELVMVGSHTDWIEAMELSPDGERLASAGGPYDYTVRVWDLETGIC